MAHTTKDKEKLLNRVRRIKGQISAIEKALESDQECSKVLQTIAACRGAINGLMAEVLEGHVRFLDTGHFALETHGEEMASRIEGFLRQNKIAR